MLFAEKSEKRPSAKAADGHFSVSVQVLAQQLAQLVDQLAEERQCVVDGRGRAHINAHVAQQLDRLLRTAAGEELLVVLDGALALAQDAVGDGNGSGKARRILEDIVVVVEVRNARPLERDLIVGDHIGAEVELVERMVLFAQRIGGQRLAALDELAHFELELGKHRLAVDRTLELVEEVVDEISALLAVGRLAEQVAHQQDLVAGRGDLGDEDDVLRRIHRLVFAGVPRMHGVAHLVDEGEHAVEVILVVEQHVGVGPAVAGAVGAAALAGVLIHVEPAVAKGLFEHVCIVLAEHRECFERGLLGLFKGDFNVRVRDDRRIDVVHVQRINAHDLLAQGNVAVHLVKVAVHRVDEIGVHRRRHLGHVERGLERGIIVARVGEELELLELRVKRGGIGVAEFARALVVGLEGVLAQRAVGARQQRHERAVGQLMRFALAVRHVGIADVRVVEHAERAAGALADLAGGGKQLLALGREDMRLAAAQLIDVAAIGLELRLFGVETRKRFVRKRHDLARFERAGARECDRCGEGFAAHALIEGVAHILVAAAACVLHKLGHTHVDLVAERKPVEQRLCALAESADEGSHALRIGLERLQLIVPRLVACKHVAQIPGELLGHLAARKDRLTVHRFTVLFSKNSARLLRADVVLPPIIADESSEYKRFSLIRAAAKQALTNRGAKGYNIFIIGLAAFSDLPNAACRCPLFFQSHAPAAQPDGARAF